LCSRRDRRPGRSAPVHLSSIPERARPTARRSRPPRAAGTTPVPASSHAVPAIQSPYLMHASGPVQLFLSAMVDARGIKT
jgi:hypothetical protein